MLLDSRRIKKVSSDVLKDFYLVQGIKISNLKVLGTYGNRFLVVSSNSSTYLLDLIDVYLNPACFSFSKLGQDYYVHCPKKFLEEVTLF